MLGPPIFAAAEDIYLVLYNYFHGDVRVHWGSSYVYSCDKYSWGWWYFLRWSNYNYKTNAPLRIWTMLRLSQEINIAKVLYPDEVGIASVASEMFCHFSLFTSSLFQDILGKLMQKENYKSLTRPLLIMHIKCSKSSWRWMSCQEKFLIRRRRMGLSMRGQTNIKLQAAWRHFDHLVTWLSSPCVTQRHSWAIQSGAMLSS